MGKLYSIGKTAELMGISVQTLRLYSKLGIVKPSFINPENGYRYYDATTFSTIDRLRYLQKLGFSLSEIKALYEKNNVPAIIEDLKQLEEKKRREIAEQQELLDSILWYQNYYAHRDENVPLKQAYIKYFDQRIAFLVEREKTDTKGEANERLYLQKNKPEYKELDFRRKFVTVYDGADFFDGRLTPEQYGIYLSPASYREDVRIRVLPAGYYICFLSRILTGDWSPDLVAPFFQNSPKPDYVIADEFEDSFFHFDESLYEVQLYFKNP